MTYVCVRARVFVYMSRDEQKTLVHFAEEVDRFGVFKVFVCFPRFLLSFSFF